MMTVKQQKKINDGIVRFRFMLEASELATDHDIRVAIRAMKDELLKRQALRASRRYREKYGV